MTFADVLKEHRARLRMTQNEVAEVLSVPSRTYWEWENGKTEPIKVAIEGALLRLRNAKPKK